MKNINCFFQGFSFCDYMSNTVRSNAELAHLISRNIVELNIKDVIRTIATTGYSAV